MTSLEEATIEKTPHEADATASEGRRRTRELDGFLESRASFDEGTATIRLRMLSPVANIELLGDILRVGDEARAINAREAGPRVRFITFEGPSTRVFGLGGDLALLTEAVEARDARRIRGFADLASEMCHGLSDGFGADVLTIAIVRGKALGGAFEAARSCDILIAEANASFGLPEVDFGLFPGAGTMTSIGSRVDARTMREMIIEGRRIDAGRAYEVGIADLVVPEGEGSAAAEREIARLAPRHVTALSTYRGLAGVRGATRESFMGEAALWSAAVSRLAPNDVDTMRRLARLQRAAAARRPAGGTAACP